MPETTGAREPYVAPKVSMLGSVADITRGVTGKAGDEIAGGNKGKGSMLGHHT